MAAQDIIDIGRLTDFVIIVSSDSSEAEKFAARHLAWVFEQCFGRRPDILEEPVSGRYPIFVGPIDTNLGDEDIAIDLQSEVLVLTGGGLRGVLYSVYEFAQRYLGVRYLTRDHTYIPDHLPETLPLGKFQFSPDFNFRWSYYYANDDDHAFASRMHVNTVTSEEELGGSTSQKLIGHSFGQQLPVAKYGKEHPEYFAMVGGKRMVEQADAQPCLSNPDVIRIVADWVIDYFDRHPEEITTSVSANDNDYWCHCDACQEINAREGSPTGSHMAFVNAVAELVERKHPDKFIGTLAYWHTQCPPKTLQVRRNVQIELAIIQGCCVHGYSDPPCHENQFMGSLVEEWGKVCDNLYIWDYYTNFGALDLPYPNIKSIGDRVRWYKKWGAKGVFMQANCVSDSGDYSDLRNYVISRILWEPHLDSWELAEEFCRLHYGNAAEDVLEHLAMIHDDAEQHGHHPGYYSTPKGLGITPESAEKGLKIFQRAKSNAENPQVLERVLRVSNCANRAAIEVCGFVLDDGVYRLDIPKSFGPVVEDYLELGERFNVVKASEALSSEEYNEQLLAAVRGFKAVKLENEVWELVVLPEKDAQIVSMLHKPSQRDLLRRRWIYWNMEQDYFKYSWSVIHEKPVEGLGKWISQDIMEVSTDRVKLRYVDENQIEIEKIINLDANVNFKTQIANASDHNKCVRLDVIAQFGTGIDTNDWGGGDSEVFGGFVEDRGEWKLFNRGWNKDHGPDLKILEEADTEKLAFYNRDIGFGVCAKFTREWRDKLRFYWYPYSGCVNLEAHSKPLCIEPGRTDSLSYSFSYLDHPPA